MASEHTPPDTAWQTARLLLAELASFLRLLYRLFGDARVSPVDKSLVFAAIAYVIAPLDLIPDVLGTYGRIDDLYFLGLILDRLLVRAGPDILLEHWDGRPSTLRLLLDTLGRVESLVPGPVRRVLSGRVREPAADA